MDIHPVAETERSALGFGSNCRCKPAIGAHNEKAHISVRNVEFTGELAETQAQWAPANVLQGHVIPGSSTPFSAHKIVRMVFVFDFTIEI